MSFIRNKAEYYLNNFIGSINLLGTTKAPGLRTFYSSITSFQLSTIAAKADNICAFDSDVLLILNRMKADRIIRGYTIKLMPELEYLSLHLDITPYFKEPEVLNIYSTYKTVGQQELEWQSIQDTYKDLLQ